MISNLDALTDRLSGITVDGEEVTPEKFVELVSDEREASLEVAEAVVLNNDGLEEFTGRVKQDGYNEGVVAGEQMATKKIKKHFGLEVEGRDFDKIADSIKDHLTKEAKQPSDKKVQQLSESLEALQRTYESEKSQWEQSNSELENKFKQQKKDAFISSNLPEVQGMKKNHLLALVRADGIDVDFTEEGDVVAVRDGKPILDKLQKSINFESVIKDWVAESGFSQGIAGRTEQPNQPAGRFETASDVFRFAEKEGISPDSEEFDKLMQKVQS